MWDYTEALEWLYARQRLGIKLGLGKVHDLLRRVGDPHHGFESVHVAGTNGKGSVTRFLAEALRRSGYRTGAYTSPHLVRFPERITVDGALIPETDVAAHLWRLRPVVEALDGEDQPPTFFEVTTALAFLHFQAAGVEWAVVETGMGGRLDATNVLTPRLTVITNVERDHTAFLGGTVAEIAYEKAGIMKPGVPCVTGAGGDALLVLKAVSRERRVPMSILGGDYHVLPDVGGLRLLHPMGEARYEVAPAGEHQLRNAALVVAACDALREQGVSVPLDAVRGALAETAMPGRLESFRLPASDLGGEGGALVEVLLDGAHNEAGARALRYHLGRRDWVGFHLIAGFNADKEWPALLEAWVPLASHVHGVPVRNPRSLDPERMRSEVESVGIPFSTEATVAAALAAAARAGAVHVLVAGSLFLVGEARALLTGESMEEVRGSQ